MQSRVEDILQAMIDGTESSELPKPQSRNEDLLLQVLDKMNEGGGGAVIDDTTVSTTKTWSSSKIDSTKLDANQGGANSGKVMGVDATGDVVPVEVEGGNIAVTETPVSGDDYAIDIVEGEHGSVTSVAGKTGVVTLNGDDVSYSDLVDYGDGTVGGEIADLKSQINNLEDKVLVPENLIDATQTVYKNNTAVTYNGDGTWTIGTNDYGFAYWVTPSAVPAGEYVLCGVPYGTTYISKRTVITGADVIASNNTGEDITYTNPTERVLYFAYNANSRPSESFILTPAIIVNGGSPIPLINSKMSKPSTDGTEGQILTADGLGGYAWESPAPPAETPELQTDGQNVFVDVDGETSSPVKFAEGCIVDGTFATEPKIEAYNKAFYSGTIVDKTGACYSTLIPVNAGHNVVVYRANASGFSFGGSHASWLFIDGVYSTYTDEVTASNEPHTINLSNKPTVNGIKVSFVMTEIEESYAYDAVNGDIYFAGKNSLYYGQKNINGFDPPTLLTDENFGELGLGFIVGKDGMVHHELDGYALGGNGIKIADSAIESALYETKPRVETYGLSLGDNQSTRVNSATCVLAKYPLVRTGAKVAFYRADSAQSPVSWGGYNDMWFYTGDTWVSYCSIGTSNTVSLANPGVGGQNADGFVACLVTDYVDDSYAYDSETGYVYFAGKNTSYYGLKNIYDATPATGLSATIETIDGSIQYSRNGSVDMIPLFLTTDQHSASVETVMEIFLRHASMDAVSKILNLGDTVGDHWIDVDPEKPLWECKQLADYANQTKNIPNDKRIDVIGNHDTWYIPDGGTIRWTNPLNHLYKYFRNPTAHYHDNHSNFTVVDPRYNVKYMVIAGYEYSGELTDYTGYKISSASLDWMIEEMSRDDGYDIIILSHQPLGANGSTYHNPVANNNFTVESIADFDYTPLWIARKNKTSGTITDASGVSHTYDFTGCKTDLICGLHGHEHKDGIAYLGDSLCDLIFHTFSDSDRIAYYFAIDRINQQVNVWRISTSNNTYTNYQLPLVKPE